MSYLQIVYESHASESLTDSDVIEILRKSQISNNRTRISGLLVFKDRRFLQFIEGPHQAVEALYARIALDSRHRNLRLLNETVCDELLMPTWAMAYTSSSKAIAHGDNFVLGHRQALSICELLPEHIARHFLTWLAEMPEAA